MKYLILGGNGFIGRQYAKFLLAHNETVYSFDLNKIEYSHPEFKYIQGDFFNLGQLEHWVSKTDIVIHAVSTINPSNSNEKYMFGYENDFLQTIRLCEIIMKYNKKMIFISSGGTVYGEQLIQPIKEDTQCVPINHYGNLKLCMENVIRTFKRQNSARMNIVRIANPYGEGQDYRKGVGFIDAVLRRGMEKEIIQIWGEGKIIRDYIEISDVCQMLYEVSKYEGNEEVFNISSARGVSQNEIIEIVRKIIPDIQIEYLKHRSVDVDKVVLDNKKIHNLCNISCIPIEQGINKYYQYLKTIRME